MLARHISHRAERLNNGASLLNRHFPTFYTQSNDFNTLPASHNAVKKHIPTSKLPLKHSAHPLLEPEANTNCSASLSFRPAA
jgi:hypothetical protein